MVLEFEGLIGLGRLGLVGVYWRGVVGGWFEVGGEGMGSGVVVTVGGIGSLGPGGGWWRRIDGFVGSWS